jgi:exosortase A
MNTLVQTLPTDAATRWRKASLLTIGMLLLLTAVFWPTFDSMVEIWERSETFTHGFLIFPISAWLVWGRRQQIAPLTPQPDWHGLVALAVAGAGWLFADAGSVNVAAQYAFVGMLVATVWALLGRAVMMALLFPLMFMFLAVPMGEFLIPPLMDFTAHFTVGALRLTGMPVFREGTFFSTPSGDWSVVEGCSGLRYLIASVTLGTLYAYLTYRSWTRRAWFILAAFIVPVFANGGRAYMIVMIATLSDMRLALGVDHYIYGWVFFGIVMLLLFWIGSFWREDDPATAPLTPVVTRADHAGAPTSLVRAAVVTVLVAAIWPAYAMWLEQRALPTLPALAVKPAAGWQAVSAFTDWVPHWVGADRTFRASFAKAGKPVLLEVDYYVTQRQGAELINSQNFMIRQKHPVWSNVGEAMASVPVAGHMRQVRQAHMRSVNGQRLLVWQWNVIDGVRSHSDLYAKLLLATDRVRLARDDGASVLIAAPYDDEPAEAARVLAAFIGDNEADIQRALDRVARE